MSFARYYLLIFYSTSQWLTLKVYSSTLQLLDGLQTLGTLCQGSGTQPFYPGSSSVSWFGVKRFFDLLSSIKLLQLQQLASGPCPLPFPDGLPFARWLCSSSAHLDDVFLSLTWACACKAATHSSILPRAPQTEGWQGYSHGIQRVQDPTED